MGVGEVEKCVGLVMDGLDGGGVVFVYGFENGCVW